MKKIFYLLLTVLPQICFAQILSYSGSSSLSWQYVGNPDFSTDTVAFPSLAITSGEVPYIAFQEYDYSRTLSVMNTTVQHGTIPDNRVSPRDVFTILVL